VNGGEFLFYQAPDSRARIQLRVQEDAVWLTQKQLAELYQVTVPVIAQHVCRICEEREQAP
jgi:hypothetical protein